MTERSFSLEPAAAASRTVRKPLIQWRQIPPIYSLRRGQSSRSALSWVVLASVKTNREVFREPFAIPTEPQFVNYDRVWSNSQVGLAFANSLITVGASVILILVVSAPAAYILSRAEFKGRGLLTMVYIAGIGIPYPLLFIPLFALLAGLRMNNSIPGLVLIYVSLSIPFTVYILTKFLQHTAAGIGRRGGDRRGDGLSSVFPRDAAAGSARSTHGDHFQFHRLME
ncbi:MAG: carbohydrate ABC transporter permease [Chloroflexi bacterium]|uniref:carbohydrate ABC transporter permease n=1 Tax=Candidatus Flexifilum breve TaxID=3140694 RepID=UPI003135B291|nr:carbohydrate ABC transporter permease [Chloroflexota bacterium]